MSIPEARYLPSDRLLALATGIPLLTTADGSALFADISGFTPITEKLRQALGARRGAETLAAHLNRVYDALIEQVERYDGSIISFAGDAMTCWFVGEDAPLRATGCAFALVDAMQTVEKIALPDGQTQLIGLKVSVATGTTRRLVVGDPDIQQIDTLVGTTIARMAAGESVAEQSEVVTDVLTVERLGAAANVREWRESDGERFAVLERITSLAIAADDQKETPFMEGILLRPWLLPAIASHFQAGLGEYLTELRPAVALFVRFTGIDYDHDLEAEVKLDRFVRLTQGIVKRYEGNVLQLTIGDKGSYLYVAFGAPFAHEDDVPRSLDAALDIRGGAASLGYLEQIQIGISRGTMRTGTYGSETRRTYGVLGDEVNLAARLMTQAAPGEILLSETLIGAKLDGYVLEALPPIRVKGKANPIGLFRLIERREQTFAQRFYTTPLVGRDGELTAVRAAIQPILEGRHAGVIYVYGEPGMGKSRLAFEVQTRLQAEAQITWLIGQADPLNRAPFSAFGYFLRPYFGQRRERDYAANLAAFDTQFEHLLALADEDNRADLLRYRSFLAGLVGLVIPGSAYESAEEKVRVDSGLTVLKAWARAESRQQPLILHLEDANWLDAVSIRAVQDLTYNMEQVPLALLLTSRYNDDGTPFTIHGIFSVPIQTIDLNRLSSEGVRAIAEAVLGGEVSDSLAAFIGERAEGNPFFTEQLALDLRERGALVEREGSWTIRAEAAADVPSSVNAVLIARLDRLSSQVKAVVQTASVLGREFDVQVLSRMLREGDRGYIQVAESEAIWSALTALRYLFRHALLRDAAYQMQVQERIRVLHRLAAETIEQLYPDDEAWHDALLEHWHVAGDLDRELLYLEPVVRRCLLMTADLSRAELLLERALRVLPPEDMRRTLPLAELSKVYEGLGRMETAAALAEEALRLAERSGDEKTLVLVYEHWAHLAMTMGKDDDTQRMYCERALTLRRAEGNEARIATNLAGLAAIATKQQAFEKARAYLDEAITRVRTTGKSRDIGLVLWPLGVLMMNTGVFAAARRHFEEARELFLEVGDRQSLADMENFLGIIAYYEGDYEQARRQYQAVLAVEREVGRRSHIAVCLYNLGEVAFRQADYEAAERYFEESLAIRRQINDTFYISDTLRWLASTALRLQKIDAARAYLIEGLTVLSSDPSIHSGASGNALKLTMLLGAAEYAMAQERWDQAATLSALIQQHPHTEIDPRRDAEVMLDDLRLRLDTAGLDAALERGKVLELDTVIEQLLTDLS